MLESDLSIAIFAPARRDNFKVDNIVELKEILPCVDRIPNPTNYQESSNMFETKREKNINWSMMISLMLFRLGKILV